MSIAHRFKDRVRTEDVLISESVDFSGLLLSTHVLQGLTEAGFKKPSPIQLKAIPLGRCGLDLIVQAKSGTGKTCVYTVVALESLELQSACVQVLVLAPTREIAIQVQDVIHTVGKAMEGLKCHTFIGGLPLHVDKSVAKSCHIAVGTPGRVKQLIDIGALKTSSIRLFILDEADKLLEGEFQESINWIYSRLPDNKQILALSATYPELMAQQLTAYMRNPTFVRLNVTDPALLGIKQYHLVVPNHPLPNTVFSLKTEAVVKILSSVSFQQCLIFSNLQTRAQNLQSELQSRNWPTACIAGYLDQKERNLAMEQLKTYKCRILISTDLTSRGIDADKVNLVINLDVPPDHETYLHRIGRAGRFGSFGAAVTIVTKGGQDAELWAVERKCGTYIHKLPDPIPNDLVTKALPLQIDDIVSIEQIINKEAQVDNASSHSQETCPSSQVELEDGKQQTMAHKDKLVADEAGNVSSIKTNTASLDEEQVDLQNYDQSNLSCINVSGTETQVAGEAISNVAYGLGSLSPGQAAVVLEDYRVVDDAFRQVNTTENTDSCRHEMPTENTDSCRHEMPTENTDSCRHEMSTENTDSCRHEMPTESHGLAASEHAVTTLTPSADSSKTSSHTEHLETSAVEITNISGNQCEGLALSKFDENTSDFNFNRNSEPKLSEHLKASCHMCTVSASPENSVESVEKSTEVKLLKERKENTGVQENIKPIVSSIIRHGQENSQPNISSSLCEKCETVLLSKHSGKDVSGLFPSNNLECRDSTSSDSSVINGLYPLEPLQKVVSYIDSISTEILSEAMLESHLWNTQADSVCSEKGYDECERKVVSGSVQLLCNNSGSQEFTVGAPDNCHSNNSITPCLKKIEPLTVRDYKKTHTGDINDLDSPALTVRDSKKAHTGDIKDGDSPALTVRDSKKTHTGDIKDGDSPALTVRDYKKSHTGDIKDGNSPALVHADTGDDSKSFREISHAAKEKLTCESALNRYPKTTRTGRRHIHSFALTDFLQCMNEDLSLLKSKKIGYSISYDDENSGGDNIVVSVDLDTSSLSGGDNIVVSADLDTSSFSGGDNIVVSADLDTTSRGGDNNIAQSADLDSTILYGVDHSCTGDNTPADLVTNIPVSLQLDLKGGGDFLNVSHSLFTETLQLRSDNSPDVSDGKATINVKSLGGGDCNSLDVHGESHMFIASYDLSHGASEKCVMNNEKDTLNGSICCHEISSGEYHEPDKVSGAAMTTVNQSTIHTAPGTDLDLLPSYTYKDSNKPRKTLAAYLSSLLLHPHNQPFKCADLETDHINFCKDLIKTQLISCTSELMKNFTAEDFVDSEDLQEVCAYEATKLVALKSKLKDKLVEAERKKYQDEVRENPGSDGDGVLREPQIHKHSRGKFQKEKGGKKPLLSTDPVPYKRQGPKGRSKSSADIKYKESLNWRSEPKELNSRSEPKELNWRSEPKELNSRSEPKELNSRSEPKELNWRSEPKELNWRSEPKELNSRSEPKEQNHDTRCENKGHNFSSRNEAQKLLWYKEKKNSSEREDQEQYNRDNSGTNKKFNSKNALEVKTSVSSQDQVLHQREKHNKEHPLLDDNMLENRRNTDKVKRPDNLKFYVKTNDNAVKDADKADNEYFKLPGNKDDECKQLDDMHAQMLQRRKERKLRPVINSDDNLPVSVCQTKTVAEEFTADHETGPSICSVTITKDDTELINKSTGKEKCPELEGNVLMKQLTQPLKSTDKEKYPELEGNVLMKQLTQPLKSTDKEKYPEPEGNVLMKQLTQPLKSTDKEKYPELEGNVLMKQLTQPLTTEISLVVQTKPILNEDKENDHSACQNNEPLRSTVKLSDKNQVKQEGNKKSSILKKEQCKQKAAEKDRLMQSEYLLISPASKKRPTKPSKSEARLAGLEISSGSTSTTSDLSLSSPSDISDVNFSDLDNKDIILASQCYANKYAHEPCGDLQDGKSKCIKNVIKTFPLNSMNINQHKHDQRLQESREADYFQHYVPQEVHSSSKVPAATSRRPLTLFPLNYQPAHTVDLQDYTVTSCDDKFGVKHTNIEHHSQFQHTPATHSQAQEHGREISGKHRTRAHGRSNYGEYPSQSNNSGLGHKLRKQTDESSSGLGHKLRKQTNKSSSGLGHKLVKQTDESSSGRGYKLRNQTDESSSGLGHKLRKQTDESSSGRGYKLRKQTDESSSGFGHKLRKQTDDYVITESEDESIISESEDESRSNTIDDMTHCLHMHSQHEPCTYFPSHVHPYLYSHHNANPWFNPYSSLPQSVWHYGYPALSHSVLPPPQFYHNNQSQYHNNQSPYHYQQPVPHDQMLLPPPPQFYHNHQSQYHYQQPAPHYQMLLPQVMWDYVSHMTKMLSLLSRKHTRARKFQKE